jgi:hypothetical protein
MAQTDYITGIRNQIESGNLPGAERDLHNLILNKDFERVWGNKDLPVLWGHISSLKLTEECPTAMVDLRDGKVMINPKFLLERVHKIEDLLFLVMHERDHRLIRRIYRVDWYRLRKILDFKDEWVAKVRNVLEDAWINASVRSSMGIHATLPEQFYCWTQNDIDNPGDPSEENPTASGFNPAEHTLGDPKSEEFALLTCLSPFVSDDIQDGHEGLYADADVLLKPHGLKPVDHRAASRSRYSYNYSAYGKMLSFPEWYDMFCDWLEVHKDDLAQPSPGSEHDEGCPQHGDGSPGEGEGEGGEGEGEGSGEGSGEGEGEGKGSGEGSGEGEDSSDSKADGSHGHGGNKPCTCNGGKGLLGEPQTLAERLSRVPDILVSKDDMDKILDGDDSCDDDGDVRKDPNGQDEPSETFSGDRHGNGASWGHEVAKQEIVPQEIEDLDDLDRGLLEMGGSVLTDSHKTSTVQIKGAVKRYADELVQNIATMRVTDHKFNRPDFNIPVRPSRRDMMRLGMGEMPVVWDHPQYIEQQELIVYTDVSGSMCNWYSVALYLTKQLREFGCESYQFSTIVCKPVPGRDDNVFWGTGGTHFDSVADHIKLKGFKSVIIITDNQDALTEDRAAFLRDEVPELYLVCLEDGTRPINIENHSWGGRYGKAGFQHCTENITGIFGSDIKEA